MDERRLMMMNLEDVHRQMERFLTHISRPPSGGCRFSACLWEPAIDVYETDEELVVLCELPGVGAEQVEVVTTGRTVTIRGERRRGTVGLPRRYHRMEVCFNDFERVIELPVPVDGASAAAEYKDGFLQISFRRARPDSGPRTIPVGYDPDRP